MICLFCETELSHDSQQACPDCGAEHDSRPPVVGVNHVSQLLGALDGFRAGEFEAEDFRAAVEVFAEMMESFEEKWKTRQRPLADRLSSSLQPRFEKTLSSIDEALVTGFRAVELLELLGEAPGEDGFAQAEAALIEFFTTVCAQAATALAELDSLKSQAATSGALFNLPSV